MSFDVASLLGGFAALISTASFAPQAWKVIKTRETKDISAGMYSLTVLGFALWIGYGVVLGQWPLIASNGTCFILSAFILGMKILPRPAKQAVADKLDPSSEH